MRITKTISQLLVTIVGIVLCSTAMLVLTAQRATVDSVRAVDAAAYHGMFNPGATLDTTQVDDMRTGDTAQQDAAAEGQDALTLAYDPAPAPLWNALTTQHPEWYDEGPGDRAGHGRFMVPVGTVVDVPGGLYLATLDDGWFTCVDFQTSDRECSATGPVVPVDVPEVAPIQTVAHVTTVNPYGAGAGAKCGTDAQCAAYSRSIGEAPSGYAALPHPRCTFTAQERKAARLILARLTTHRHVEEDWTWQGMPRVVGAHSDALSRAAQAAGLHGNNWPWSSKARTWLSQVVRTGKG